MKYYMLFKGRLPYRSNLSTNLYKMFNFYEYYIDDVI